MPRFELVEGTASKFWEIELNNTEVIVTFGRIGTSGQVQKKSFGTEQEAQKHYDKSVAEKLKKGYASVDAPRDVGKKQQKGKPLSLEAAIAEARDIALKGDAEAAIASFENLLSTGDASVMSQLAQLYALSGRWRDVLKTIDIVVSQPQLIFLSAHDSCLAARAALKADAIAQLQEIAHKQVEKITAHKKPIPLYASSLLSFANGDAAARETAPLQKMFEKLDADHKPLQSEYAEHIAHLTDHMPPYARKDPKYKSFYSFHAAMDFHMYDEAFRLYNEHSSLQTWQQTIMLARILCSRKEHESAWSLIFQALPEWQGSNFEVAPVELIADEDFLSLMNEERCRQLLNTARSTQLQQSSSKVEAESGAKRQRRAVKKLTIALSNSDKSITEPVTKFGGQPNWLGQPEWPLSKRHNKPMSFICQIKLEPSIFGKIDGKMAYVFMSSDEIIEVGADATWEPDSGENAVIIQPGGETLVSTAASATGPAFFDEKAARLTTGVDSSETVDDEADCSELKVGGLPAFMQNDEYPEGGPSQWHLLLQASETHLPEVNFGTGCAYAFISKDGKRGKFLWQCD